MKTGAGAWLRFSKYSSTMVLHNFFADGEAYARSFIIVDLRQAFKHREYSFGVLLVEADTVVTNNNLMKNFSLVVIASVVYRDGNLWCNSLL